MKVYQMLAPRTKNPSISINVGFQVDSFDKCAETPGTSSLKVWISNECLHHPVWYISELFSKLLSPFLVDPPIVN